MKAAWMMVLLAPVLAAPVTAQPRNAPAERRPADAAPPPVQVETSVSRTAVWVGDRVTYTVRLRCAPRVEIVADDLVADRLQTSGLEMLSVTADRDTTEPYRRDEIVHRVRYTFVTYRIDDAPLTIAEFPVRYSITRPGANADAGAPAGEVRVPALSVALRSTMAENDSGRAIRDGRARLPVPRRVRLAEPLGLGLLLLAVAPVALWVFGLIRRLRRARARPEGRTTRKQLRASLDDIKALDVRSVESRREACAQLDTWVRHRVREATGVEAAALTPPELSVALSHAAGAPWLESVHAVLAECERAKYAAEPPPAERWPALLHEAGQFLTAPRR